MLIAVIITSVLIMAGLFSFMMFLCSSVILEIQLFSYYLKFLTKTKIFSIDYFTTLAGS
jgi:hypothetical protein